MPPSKPGAGRRGRLVREAAQLETAVNTTRDDAPVNVAVLLRGSVRAGAETAAALVRHLVRPYDASIFYLGSEDVTHAAPEDEGQPSAVYGPALKGFAMRSPVRAGAAGEGGAGPSALLNDLADIEAGYNLLRRFEEQHGMTFDQVVLTRSDVVLYAKPDLNVAPGQVHIVAGSGFDTVTGAFVAGNAPVLPFRDPSTGDLTPLRTGDAFSDTLLVVSGADLALLGSLSADAAACLRQGAPAHLETLLYLLLVGRGGLASVEQPDWRCETLPRGQARPVTFRELAAYRRADLSDAVAIARAMVRVADDAEMERKARPRVAVLLYGLLREYKRTANSLLRHVVEPNDASIFYFGPKETDIVTRDHDRGERDEHGFFLSNPKGRFTNLTPLADTDLTRAYGRRLIGSRFHDKPQQEFLDTANAICSGDDWLFMLSPHRLLSMFYNISGAIELLYAHERASGEIFDEVIITRPDLAFYAPVSPEMKSGEIHIPLGEGFDENGYVPRGNAPAYFYKNAAWGAYVPPGREVTFNDQVLALRREDLRFVRNLYDQLVKALAARVPASPETILYLLLIKEAGLKPVYHPDWTYQILRADDPTFRSVLDTPDLVNIDPHHPRLVRRAAELARAASLEGGRADAAEASIARREGLLTENTALLDRILTEGKAERPASGGRTGRARWLLARARRARRGGDLNKAEQLYAAYLRMAPRRQREWVQYGHVLKENGHRDAALVAYRMALAIHADADATLHHNALSRDLEQS